jgi:hypothetical protein
LKPETKISYLKVKDLEIRKKEWNPEEEIMVDQNVSIKISH